ncbi:MULTISPECIES: hypothetical protein [unclassified Serratia (in: enterobacteria)]|uniref:hypothetical protein n=1 Tax=unclassified Serratia (in: enterobacteria) TaxID=2647522 RepID=UPI000469C5A3|nr:MULTISPECIES: hypothetical protein [unclassified Serratia (in: enterobacteria)]
MSMIFRQCMPYGIRRKEDGSWEAFNRDYNSLGDSFFFKRSLTQATINALAPPPITQKDGSVWLYIDTQHPMDSAANWEAYSGRLKKLMSLKMKDER